MDTEKVTAGDTSKKAKKKKTKNAIDTLYPK